MTQSETTGRAQHSFSAACNICGRAWRNGVEVVPQTTAQTWQPIASAPKDGRKLLLWWRADYGVAYWACAHWQEFGDGSKGWIGESFHASEPDYWTRFLGDKPTHWMPLPATPEVGSHRLDPTP